MNKILLIFIFTLSLNAKVDYEKYCIENNVRETNIVIDLNNLDSLLYGKIIQELTYFPHEKVNINVYKPKEKSLQLLYTFCNPKLSQQEIKKINNLPAWKKAMGTSIDISNDDQMFLKSKITNKLAKIQSYIVSNKKETFTNALLEISSELKEQSRLIIFSKEKLNKKIKKIDFKYANVFMYQKSMPSKTTRENNINFFMQNNAYLNNVKTRLVRNGKNKKSLNHYKIEFNTIVKNKALKSSIIANIDNNGNIENGWIEIIGVMISPIRGKIKVSGDKITSIKVKVPKNTTYKNNTAKKGDTIEINIRNGKIKGKYYNYSYNFINNKYFEYKVN